MAFAALVSALLPAATAADDVVPGGAPRSRSVLRSLATFDRSVWKQDSESRPVPSLVAAFFYGSGPVSTGARTGVIFLRALPEYRRRTGSGLATVSGLRGTPHTKQAIPGSESGQDSCT